MEFTQILGQFFTGMVISFLSFTNTIATHINEFVPHTQKHVAFHRKPAAQSKESLVQASNKPLPNTKTLANILLTNQNFQRAAVNASTQEDASTTQSENLSTDEVIKSALVNIYCQQKTPKYIRTTTGTGFFISTKGVILTNAHVAQFLLLTNDTDRDVSCVIRSGDPATPQYKAELLYISPTWIFDNADLITEETPRGTGERDYALLYISKSLNTSPLPSFFPTIGMNTDLLPRSTEGTSVITAGYPAEALLRNGADAKLFPVVASTTVNALYTFGSNYADLLSITESPVGEEGSSGGPIVTIDTAHAIGLITTKGDEATEGVHSLRALTLSYIDRTITEETGFSLAQNMQGDVAYRGKIFQQAMAPFLTKILEDKLVN